uniref:Rerating family member 3 gamma n=1 Tax=Saimiri boliviensis boliviensis TaxID=39432 RepID=A0A2K6V8G2_SAIBB
MLPPMALPSVSWMLLSCLMLLSQVQGAELGGDGWEWSSTDVMNYFAWEKNPSTITNPGHCGSLSRSTGFLKWKDYNCDSTLPYVCKFKV